MPWTVQAVHARQAAPPGAVRSAACRSSFFSRRIWRSLCPSSAPPQPPTPVHQSGKAYRTPHSSRTRRHGWRRTPTMNVEAQHTFLRRLHSDVPRRRSRDSPTVSDASIMPRCGDRAGRLPLTRRARDPAHPAKDGEYDAHILQYSRCRPAWVSVPPRRAIRSSQAPLIKGPRRLHVICRRLPHIRARLSLSLPPALMSSTRERSPIRVRRAAALGAYPRGPP
ncbi:hypothetical protein BV25DRAFT_1828209 [Artomyces pyxidatus]|uniref:Uncharacterized protein n=1 Tax=Artomyces pyxidatus TaxID=48021 RepID=A0ACB8SUJ0_9AGAM|nr:hypothetical protein BV25DRAFT_1828209 [Artomyces pyxidatus]